MDTTQTAFIGMPCYTDMAANPFGVKRATLENGLLGHMPFAFEPAVSSALPYTFNLLWAKALAGNFDFFFMLHSDIVPKPGWAKTLLDILLRENADVVSAHSPLKGGDGVFSVGVSGPNRWGPYYRFTAKQLRALPETFSIADTDCPDKTLVVNTGCFVADLRKPWVREQREDGSLKVAFDFRNRIYIHPDGKLEPNLEPEDWRFSRDLAEMGCKVLATRAVELIHFGTKAWNSAQVWGMEIDPLADKEYVARHIDSHGAWQTELDYAFDGQLADALTTVVSGKILDAGCGRGDYVKALRQAGLDAIGVDGEAATAMIPNCRVCDLAVPQSNEYLRDWVVSLEVGEHIPAEFESVFLDNLANFASVGIVLSWAPPNQPGSGHVNGRQPDWVAAQMQLRGFSVDAVATAKLRDAAVLHYFKTNLLVFRKG